MKKKRRKFGRICVTISFAVICILLAIVFLAGLLHRAKIGELQIEPKEPVVEFYSNVYVFETNVYDVRFLYDQLVSQEGEPEVWEHMLTMPNDLGIDYEGVCDLKYVDYELVEFTPKTEYIDGKLLAYDGSRIRISEDIWLPYSKDCVTYRTYTGEVMTYPMHKLVVGASDISFCVYNGEICALVQKTPTETEDIRVVLMDSDGNYIRSSLYLYCKNNWTCNGDVIPKAKTFDVMSYMMEHDLYEATFTGDSDIAITTSKGKKIGEYFKGTIYVVCADPAMGPSGGIVAVSILPVEEYVRYVLPSEMPASFHYEAFKAQAVCARTYAYSQMRNGTYAAYGANIDNSTAFQVYNEQGTSKLTDKAAKETEGQVAAYDGELITCYYFSTSPGVSDGLNMWAKEDVPYLTAHNFTQVDVDFQTEEGVHKFLEEAPKSYDDASSFYRWKAKLMTSQENLEKLRSEAHGLPISMEITKRSKMGYVVGMKITYEDLASEDLTTELQVRRFVGKLMSELELANGKKRTDFTSLPSAYFYLDWEDTIMDWSLVNYSDEKNANTIYGGGFGHGIGLSQYGASAMGNAGFNYEEILKYYYEDIAIVDEKSLDVYR